jgi:hypothetical protein
MNKMKKIQNVVQMSDYRKIHIPDDALVRVAVKKDGRLHLEFDASGYGITCNERCLPKWFWERFNYLRTQKSKNGRGTVSVEFGMRLTKDIFYISCA